MGKVGTSIKTLSTLLTLILINLSSCSHKDLSRADFEQVGFSTERFAKLRSLINAAIERKEFPGAVLIIGRKGKIVMREAFGESQWVPSPKKMRPDMIFDLASITKPIATATSVMILIQDGKLRLFDRVDKYIPEFTTHIDEAGKPGEPVRIYHLLTHTSGLPAYTNAEAVEKKYGSPCPDSLVLHIARLEKLYPPGIKFTYSCLGFITLAEIVKRISGQPLNEFASEHIFRPLGMKSTGFELDAEQLKRCVPTEVIDGELLIGVVNDELARLMGGISGNAGLFSTADDLAIFAQMMLQGGQYGDIRILSPLTTKRMTTIYERTAFSGRALGWDVSSNYSTNGGDLFPPGAYGHTGYTGTSIWIDPTTQTFIIFLTNRVHPDDSRNREIVEIRSYVANIVASAIVQP